MESRIIGKRVLWQGRAGRVGLGVWEFKHVSNRDHIFVDRAAVLSAGDKPGVWFGMDDAPDVRALLEHIENIPYGTERKAPSNVARETTDLLAAPALDGVAANPQVSQTTRELEASIRLKQEPSIAEHQTLGDVATEAAELLAIPELDRAAADQRVLQAARVLESGIRFRQEPPTNACTRASWANVKLPEDQPLDIIRAINDRLKNPESPTARADAERLRAAMASNHNQPRNMPAPDDNWLEILEQNNEQRSSADGLAPEGDEQHHQALRVKFERRPYQPRKPQKAYAPLTQHYARQW